MTDTIMTAHTWKGCLPALGRYRLRDLGELRTGFQLRGAAKHDPEGRHPIIQLGDVRDGTIDFARLVRMNLHLVWDVLMPGDILLRSRGASYGAAVVPPDCPPETVAAAPLYVFRTDSTLFPIVLPEYLAWYINRPNTQAGLAGLAHGSSILTVGVQAFGGLEV